MFRIKSFVSLIQVFFMLISSVSVYTPSVKKWADHKAYELVSTSDFSFEPLTSDESKISESEKEKCRTWFIDNILTDRNPAYSFAVDGKELRENIDEWNISIASESETGAVFRGGKTTYITLESKENDLSATVEATIYEEYATCEWTVYIQNTGSKNSPAINNFRAADCYIPTGKSDLYCLYGSDNENDDFKVRKSSLSEDGVEFNATSGRNTSWLPYFNIDGDNFGFVTAVGWTGQWKTTFSQLSDAVHFTAEQEYFDAYLTPGEKVRSPLVSLSFYETGKPIKGYNIYRSFSKDLLVTESIEQRVYQCATGSVEDVRETLECIKSTGVAEYIDTFWFDAASWFYNKPYSSWYLSAGDWYARKDWYPNGFVEVSDMLEENGIDTMLWFEPERVKFNTLFYNECHGKGWLMSNGSFNFLLNLADDECCDWYIEYMVTFFKENNLDEFREDFNIDPLTYWLKYDGKGRVGITENHYVTNLYRFLDAMLESIDNLRIDNCSSGGRRIDCEMMRRSVPLWRSDYQCDVRSDAVEACQVQSYGLSLVLPYSCIDYEWAEGDYEILSNITPIREVHYELAIDDPETCKDHLKRFNSVKEYLIENYYPLTPSADVDFSTWIAMQYGTSESGLVMAYRHKEASDTVIVKLSEINPESEYTLSYPFNDSAESVVVSGRQLCDGFKIQSSLAPEAIIIEYVCNPA